MKLLSYICGALSIAGAAMASACNRDLECLTSNAQITFIGQIVTRDFTNTKYFSATVKPLCNMYGNVGGITQEEYSRTITIGGFGNHAGGTCDAEIGNVGDIDIFFVHVNNTVANGGVRTFGLYDPCYGAFRNNTDNYIQLTKYAVKNNYTPNGVQCPSIRQEANGINIDGTSYPNPVDLNEGSTNTKVNLDENTGDAPKTFVMTSMAFVVLGSLIQLFL
ncbi:hypothetical protein H8356DRAFT_1669692 [Neocallimastix lanati (nom. inval.)]|jgi:hypothetical protein|uniref:Uncharacterized protein n=1 Tax=Neocallimastix californiae TaxID=1754190 RepID=A0A1Y2EWB1_9FUNG|nr:hypothetical protein H8356DRAFT_1669692 [Neocallimastix sp. JGI-2020a]ORY75840.1 hypothetical protein LY90DRAFT_665714 [Neocallimastix californiae]|eukprot:ORY75840.1 hypothetical protein LY90DRAFT_665714 [Neocallimastix californiae]